MGSMCWWASYGGNTIMGYIKNNASQLGYTLSTEAQQREELGKSHDVNLYKNIENDGG